MKKVGILTYHAAHNYGSMLQAWALQQYLMKIGIESEDINLRIEGQRKLYKFPLKYKSFKEIIYSFLSPRITNGLVKQWQLFEQFIKEELHTTKEEYHSWKEIRSDLPALSYDAIIVGGDQVWNFSILDYEESYVLPSEINGIKKISYSPSMGGHFEKYSTDAWKEYITKHLSSFDFLSVRDNDCAAFISEVLSRYVLPVADPTLLLEAKDYECIIHDSKNLPYKYILYYTPWDEPKAEKIAQLISVKYGLPVVTTKCSLKFRQNSFVKIINCGPKEFLGLLKNAEIVCGKSYHLLVFSLLFHKEFVSIDGDCDARMKGLLTDCNLLDRAVKIGTTSINDFSPIDYNLIDKVLSCIRNTGISYIDSWKNI